MHLTLYSIFHKPFIRPRASFIEPIQAGRLLATDKLPITGDDTGDHISQLNPYFCELTAMYWIWKNAARNDSDAWGICHYRRYFTQPVRQLFSKPKALLRCRINQQQMDKYVNDNTRDAIISMLQAHEIVMATPIYIYKKKGKIRTMEEHYLERHIPEHWEALKSTLLGLYPDYRHSLDLFCQARKMSYFNMAVAPWRFWDDYFQWLFPLLFALHEKLRLPADPYQSRAIGFLAERLINLYVWHNKTNCGYMPVAVFEKKP